VSETRVPSSFRDKLPPLALPVSTVPSPFGEDIHDSRTRVTYNSIFGIYSAYSIQKGRLGAILLIRENPDFFIFDSIILVLRADYSK
jgi:hypothetical protein